MSKKTLYISNLPYTASQETLKLLLEPFSPCEVSMISGRKFAYVEVDSQKAEAVAEALRRVTLSGRRLEVREAEFIDLDGSEQNREGSSRS